jgi:hypothetical protein
VITWIINANKIPEETIRHILLFAPLPAFTPPNTPPPPRPNINQDQDPKNTTPNMKDQYFSQEDLPAYLCMNMINYYVSAQVKRPTNTHHQTPSDESLPDVWHGMMMLPYPRRRRRKGVALAEESES